MATSLQNLLAYSNAGIVIPDTSAIRDAIIAELEENVFQQEIDKSQESALGRLVEWLTVTFAQVAGMSAWMTNQMNLKYASGAFLDAWASNFGIERRGASNSRVLCVCQGTTGTVIPQGSLVSNTSGDLFSLDGQVTLDSSGAALGYFTAVNPGNVPCGASSVNVISTAIVGWTSVNNTNAGTPGSDRESDYSLRQRIAAGFMNGDGYTAAMSKRLLQVEGVQSVCVIDNPSTTPATIRGIADIPAHSIFVCVFGGDSSAIADVIFRTKPLGTGYYKTGITPVSVSDEYGNSADVYFARPTTKSTGNIGVTVKNVSYGGSDLQADITRIISDFIASVGIGGSFTTTQLAVAIQNGIQGILVTNVTVATTTYNANEVPAMGTVNITVNYN